MANGTTKANGKITETKEMLEQKMTEMIEAAIKAGDVLLIADEVKIRAAASPNGKDASKSYDKLVALNAKGMQALCGGKMSPATDKPAEGPDNRTDAEKAAGACDYFNYGYDLDVRASVRQELIASLEGPEKTIKKAFDGMVLAGYNKQEAADLLRVSPKFKGVEGLENLLKRVAA
jgi:hypothetical protein